MKKIQKKKQHILQPRTILIFAAAGALIMGTAVFVVLRREASPQVTEIHTASEYVTNLAEYSLDEITSVTVTPPLGEPYTLLVQNGALVLEEDPSFPLRTSMTSLLEANICTVRSEKTILDTAEHPVRLADFGLDPCKCMCSFQMKDGSVNTLRIGNQIVGEDIPYHYFMWNDDPRIFAGGTDMYSALSYDRSLIHTVTQPSLNKDLLDAMEISGQNTLSLRYTEFGWIIASPVSYPADPVSMSGYLDSVSGILFSRYICETDETDLKALGLDEPILTLTVTEAESILTVPDTDGEIHTYPIPEVRTVFRFGTDYDEYNRYVEYNGSVYTATRYLTDFLFDVSAGSLCLPNPINLDIYQMTGLEVSSSSLQCRYDIILTEQVSQNGSLVTDEMGNTLYDCTVRRNGESMDTDAFLAWYGNCLRQVVPSGTADGASSPDGEPAAVFTLFGAKEKRTVAFYASGLQYRMYVDGTCLYYISSQTFEQLFPLP